jgi:hypothetical protein
MKSSEEAIELLQILLWNNGGNFRIPWTTSSIHTMDLRSGIQLTPTYIEKKVTIRLDAILFVMVSLVKVPALTFKQPWSNGRG